MKINVNKKAVGSRIKQIRMNKGYTLEAFGKLFNASKGNVQQWENGVSLPNKERLASISKIADMTVNELLYGSTYEFINNNFDNLLSDKNKKIIEDNALDRDFLRQWLSNKNYHEVDINDIDKLQYVINSKVERYYHTSIVGNTVEEIDEKKIIDEIIDKYMNYMTNSFQSEELKKTDTGKALLEFVKETEHIKWNMSKELLEFVRKTKNKQ
jgi:DNA-binding helix-turn-helix protein